MRKIEAQMIEAINAKQNWSSGNTEVQRVSDYFFVVYLHGNKIATIDDSSLTLFDGGYRSATTKSRLNALCAEFCIPGEGVFQKDFLWYVHKFVGQAGQSKVYNADEFRSGYVFS
tara:strand:+ start:2833 stop:3177 length:345 start_codon:yes stop_codon:yes gene_type:complete